MLVSYRLFLLGLLMLSLLAFVVKILRLTHTAPAAIRRPPPECAFPLIYRHWRSGGVQQLSTVFYPDMIQQLRLPLHATHPLDGSTFERKRVAVLLIVVA